MGKKNSVQVRIPLGMYKEIKTLQTQMKKEVKERFGKDYPITFVKAANEFNKKRNMAFFGGKLL